MLSISRLFFVATAFSMATMPALAQGASSTPHMLVKYRPASGEYCFDTAPMDAGSTAITHLPNMQCKSQTDWAADGITVTRR